MKHLALFLGFAACGSMPAQSSSSDPQPETRQQAPAAPTVAEAAAAVQPAPIPWRNWPGDGVVRCHFDDPNMVSADLTVTIAGDTHTSTLHVVDAATGLEGQSTASYRPVASPPSLEIVSGTSVSWAVDGGLAKLGWVAGLDIDSMVMSLACGGEYAASHRLCTFPHGLPQVGCTYTAAP